VIQRFTVWKRQETRTPVISGESRGSASIKVLSLVNLMAGGALDLQDRLIRKLSRQFLTAGFDEA